MNVVYNILMVHFSKFSFDHDGLNYELLKRHTMIEFHLPQDDESKY